ncbi:hypothetical protein AURDEDRAFT_164409 [Auricularia subglabra TFB-10046 SS5]|nr:hypothetical protein AURDEDRAFT_164409 [Auricularia subglabra TFB-10046 SS5]
MAGGFKVAGVLTIVVAVALTGAARLRRTSRSVAHSTQPTIISNGRSLKWDLQLAKVHKATEDTQHYSLNGELGSLEWATLLPRGGGLLRLGPDDEVFSISMFHQLRCLDIIGHELMSRAGRPPSALSHHCMNYLRQMILCRADTTLESAKNPHGPHIVVQDITHTSDEIERMTDGLHESFGQMFFGGALGSKELSRDLLKHHINAALVDPAGEVWAVESDAGDVLGVAVWFGPGSKYLATPEQRQVGWDDLYAQLDGTKQQCAYDDLTNEAFGEGVKLGGYHLQVIGVIASAQRQGVGRALFKAVEEKARARAVCTCLETVGDYAVPIYRSLGYEVKGPVMVKTPINPDATMPMYGFLKSFT